MFLAAAPPFASGLTATARVDLDNTAPTEPQNLNLFTVAALNSSPVEASLTAHKGRSKTLTSERRKLSQRRYGKNRRRGSPPPSTLNCWEKLLGR